MCPLRSRNSVVAHSKWAKECWVLANAHSARMLFVRVSMFVEMTVGPTMVVLHVDMTAGPTMVVFHRNRGNRFEGRSCRFFFF